MTDKNDVPLKSGARPMDLSGIDLRPETVSKISKNMTFDAPAVEAPQSFPVDKSVLKKDSPSRN